MLEFRGKDWGVKAMRSESIFTDIQDLALERLKEVNERLYTLIHICKSLTSEIKLDPLLELIINSTSKIIGADRSTIFLLDKEKEELWSRKAQGLEVGQVRFSIQKGLAGHVAKTGESLNCPDVNKDLRFNKDIDLQTGYHTKNLITVPLKGRGGKIIGVLQVVNKFDNMFTKEDEEILHALASQAAIALENAMLYEKLDSEAKNLFQENVHLKNKLKEDFFSIDFMVKGKEIQEILALVEKVSPTDSSILITGESGTGKELIAKIIHQKSPRKNGEFVPLNCASLPESLLESELFGIEKGVATGVEKRIGKIEQAQNGTLFLDEVADMSLATQAKLLRVLEEKEFCRIGSNKTIKVNFRVLAATNKDLIKEIREGRFREDLYYRLNVFSIHIPSLRERKEDIPILAEHFLNKNCKKLGKRIPLLAPEAMKLLVNYKWPGNVRELENEIERTLILWTEGEISPSLFSERIRQSNENSKEREIESLKDRKEAMEKEIIKKVLEEFRGNRTKTAAKLGLSRQGLLQKMNKYGIG